MKNKKISNEIVVGVILLIAILTAGAFYLQNKRGTVQVMPEVKQTQTQIQQTAVPQQDNSQVENQQNKTQQQNDQIYVAGIVNAKSYLVEDFLKQNSSISASSVDLIKELTDYNKLLSGDKHYAQIDTVNDSVDKNTIYFVDMRFHFQSSLNRPDIYKLNLSTGELLGIYKSADSSYDMKLVGIKNNNLLFFKKGNDDSPGPCFNWWVDVHDRLLSHPKNQATLYNGDLRTIKSINVNSINSGFSNFVIPKEKYESELVIQKNCIANFNK